MINRNQYTPILSTEEEGRRLAYMSELNGITVSEYVHRLVKKDEKEENVKFFSEKEAALNWKEWVKDLSKSALITLFLILENEGMVLSPSDIEKTGLMTKGTASKSLQELRDKKYLNSNILNLYRTEEDKILANCHYSVYKLTFPNNAVYIGITGKEPKDRWNCGNGYKNNPDMFAAVMKYGWDNIEKEILASKISKKEAEDMETTLIKYYSCLTRVYNRDKV